MVYTCGCPSPDIVELHSDYDEDNFCDVCGWTMDEAEISPNNYLVWFEEWLNDISADEVKEIKTTTEFIGVAPGRLKDIQRTTDKATIAGVIDDYKSIIMTRVSGEDAEVDGGGAFTIEFILTNGEVKKIYFNNGIYNGNVTKPELSSLQYYRVDNIPTLEYYDNVTKSNGFITYIGTGTVYDSENNAVCEIQIDEFEFVPLQEDFSIPPTHYRYTVQTEFGTLVFVQNDLFYIVEEDNRVYYKLINKNLDELINDSNDSNDIFYAAAYPQDFEYNGRHYRVVQGVGLKTTVTQEELGELLGYIIREEDVSAFTKEYPNVDYVIDNGIYDYETNNRVAFYSVKAYPDLSLICMNQLGEYVLFQDITDLLA